MAGWLKLHRKLLDSNMYKSLNAKQRDVLFSCLMLTNHSENEWEFNNQIFKCKSGQFVTSLDSIAKNCGSDVKVQSVRTALLKLEKWGFLTNESTKTGRLITICKWDTYQQDEKQTNKQPNRKPTKHQQSTNKELTPNKNVKNVKNEDKEPHSNEHEDTFKVFWDHFHETTEKPKKEKAAAFKYWKKLNLTDQRKAYMMVKPLSLSNIDKDYLPYARTYLSGRSFDNEFTVDKPKAQGKETYEQIVSRTTINKRQTF